MNNKKRNISRWKQLKNIILRRRQPDIEIARESRPVEASARARQDEDYDFNLGGALTNAAQHQLTPMGSTLSAPDGAGSPNQEHETHAASRDDFANSSATIEDRQRDRLNDRSQDPAIFGIGRKAKPEFYGSQEDGSSAATNRYANGIDAAKKTSQSESFDVDYTLHNRPAVTHEHIKPHVHTIYEPRRMRSLHLHEHRTVIQPIVNPDAIILPERHWVKDDTGAMEEVSLDRGRRLLDSTGTNSRLLFGSRVSARPVDQGG